MSASPYAGLVSRLTALLLDGIVVTILVLTVSSLPELTWTNVSPLTVPRWLAGATSIIATFIPLIYFAVFWTMTGQTLGNLATGIVVEHRDGRRVSGPHALVRAALGLLLAPLWLVGMLSILADRRRRAWHDRLLRTDVRYAAPRC